MTSLLAGLRERIELGDDVVSRGKILDRFYLPTRYPNGWDVGSPKDYCDAEDAKDASAVRRMSYGSVTVFWLDSREAIRRLSLAAEGLLEEEATVRGVYLFGSLAQGRAVPGSDADVLVLLERSLLRFVNRPLDFLHRFEEVGITVDLFCYTTDEVQKNPFARRALGEAQALAERNPA